MDCHCEWSAAIQKPWIAAPLTAARDDEADDLQIALAGEMHCYCRESGATYPTPCHCERSEAIQEKA